MLKQYIENVEYCSFWLKKLEERRGDENGTQKNKDMTKMNKSDAMEEELPNNSNKMEEELKEKQAVLQISN